MVDELGYKETILQDGEPIYFRSHPEGGVALFAGTVYNTNGKDFCGSNAQSGTLIGRVTDTQLSNYIERRKVSQTRNRL